MQAVTTWRSWAAAVASALVLVLPLVVAVSHAATPPGIPQTWGGNSFGQLGDASTTPRTTPGAVVGLTDVIDLHSGREHVVALRADGTVVTWGSNQMGQLGIGSIGGFRTTPVPVTSLSDVTLVSTGHYHSLALRADGSVWTWGYNHAGQLGDGTVTSRSEPVRVPGTRTYSAVAAGRDMSYAVATDGTVWAWGLNSSGQLGDGTTVNRTTPVRVTGLTDVTQVAGGRDHALAVRSDGSVWSWGWNAYGQLGDGTLTNRSAPVRVVVAGARMVVAGAHHSYALRTDGDVLSWGRNYRAALGDGTTSQRTRPVAVIGVAGAVSIGSGRDHGIAVLGDGTARAWGHNTSGKLGDGTTVNRTSAVPVLGLTDAVKAAGGAEFTVALSTPGGAPANQPPVARATGSCVAMTCSFDGSTSDDPDGSIVSYAWDFGDGTTGTGPTPRREYAAPGSFEVTLTVTDDDGATGVTSLTVDPAPPTAVRIDFVAASGSNRNAVTSGVTVPSTVLTGDRLVLFVAANRNASSTVPAGWTLLGTQLDGSDLRSWAYTRTAVAGSAGSTVAVTLDATTKVDMRLSAYRGTGQVTASAALPEPGNGATHDSPAVPVAVPGSRVVHHWVTKTNVATTWSLPSILSTRTQGAGSGSGALSAVVGDGGPAEPSTWPARTATASEPSGKAIAWSVVLGPE